MSEIIVGRIVTITIAALGVFFGAAFGVAFRRVGDGIFVWLGVREKISDDRVDFDFVSDRVFL